MTILVGVTYFHLTTCTEDIKILADFSIIRFALLGWLLCLNIYYIECNTNWERPQISLVVILTFFSIVFIITKIRR